ncbi:alpha-L-fucosidase [Conexibacter woesei]|uniref:alpha-L-fucosidase n=1 Tax=Conexibacter woesei TaxID=191495 RepID=UPI00031F23CA|nr:alpha-L-fucosidase [Conexibacter woesei]
MSAQTPPVRSDYQRGWRRMLVDMEIPGWEQRFLSEFDAGAMADLYARAGLTSVMFACKSLAGYCFWPAQVGPEHPGTAGRDVVGQTVAALAERGIAACAYYSVIFDNWAHEHDPDWRLEPVGGRRRTGTTYDRHALCCPNSPGYRDYVRGQIADLYGRYDVGAAFCDMSFWPAVCGCRHCRDRCRSEIGAELPATIDWTDATWCAFAAARERWIAEFQGLVTDAMRAARPGIAVHHNFALGPVHWVQGVPFAVTEHSDFLGGDLYGDATEQLVVTKLMGNLSRSRPVEFMSFGTVSYSEHVRLKTAERMRSQALAATAESSACMFIDGIDPLGTANARLYDRVGATFDPVTAFEPHLGGEPVEDVAVYFSDASKVDFGENGAPLAERNVRADSYPHLEAVRGACRALQRAHVPFGVLTRRQLGELERWRVLVLPNVVRMDAEEVAAVSAYVRAGGRVYASGYSSLVETRGVRHDDFMLGDVFGVELAGEEVGRVAYATPATERMRALTDPQRELSWDAPRGSLAGGLLRLRPRAGAVTQTLATLSLPYGHPHLGDMDDREWASVHCSPPWTDTGEPAIVRARFGAGETIYSAHDVERQQFDVNERLFAGLVGDLLGDAWTVRCETRPDVWVSVFDHADRRTRRIALLNSPAALVPRTTLRIRPPVGARFEAVQELPSGRPLAFETEADGTARVTLGTLPELTMVAARWGGEQA